MAEALLRQLLPPSLRDQVEVASAGTHAQPGSQATPQAIQAAADKGLDLRAHRSQSLTSLLVRQSDLILGMEAQHVDRVRSVAPELSERVHLLSELFAEPGSSHDGIHDPFGGSPEIYEECLRRIENHLRRILPGVEERVAGERPRLD
jgi:protein-tyrosine phosphatase